MRSSRNRSCTGAARASSRPSGDASATHLTKVHSITFLNGCPIDPFNRTLPFPDQSSTDERCEKADSAGGLDCPVGTLTSH